MSTPEPNENFFAEFLNDYFAECDEHLTAIRKNLLAIEAFIDRPQIDRSLLDKLFGSFHSIKGLSGMVGLKEAEQLAHDMESYLRSLRDKLVILTQSGIDALIAGTKMLEQVINAYRTKNSIPDIELLLVRLTAAFSGDSLRDRSQEQASGEAGAALADESGAETEQSLTKPTPTIQNFPTPNLPSLNLKAEEKQRIAAAVERGIRAWQIEFSPSAEKSAKGINVNTVRSRLQSIGELIHASPIVMANGSIAFDFIVTSHVDAATFDSGEEEGLIIAPFSLGERGDAERGGEENFSYSKLQNQNFETPLTLPPNVVRVDLSRLDELMRMVGELVITRARLEENLKSLKPFVPASNLRTLRETTLTLERQLRDLREGVMRVRLVPIGEIFTRMQFVIRDLAKESQKQIALELSGQTTEIDKFVVERTIDPLLHLVRNAASHGLEDETERVAQGKPKQGKISLRASTAGEMVIIEVEDDGRGVDVEKVTKRAKEQRLISDDVTLDPVTLLDVICSSGFSTREQADKISGRGVGMAVVKSTIQELGGCLTLETEAGKGTRFTIQLPLTLAIADALIVSLAGQPFAIPLSSVREVMQIQSSNITYLESNEIISYRSYILPLIRLTKVFKLEKERENANADGSKKDAGNSQFPLLNLVVVGSGLGAVGLVVDRILGQQEIVIRSLSDPLVQVAGISGATELGDGRVVLILDTLALTRMTKVKNSYKPGDGTVLQIN